MADKMLDLRMSDAAIADAERALAELHGPDKGGFNSIRRLNEAAFLGERYAQALVEDWKTMRAALTAREDTERPDERKSRDERRDDYRIASRERGFDA
jgi:hypothetical protein